ncbi:hypothetical protein CBR_g63156 [Chara braunii]|uniref:CCHC-type domain-containing protein n=1 Tax=Chara braunii TaxID=69332 RepID=A0A388MFF8_CHABU|nr:hypothetical protein CBR_g63156 [Chara braunii]|eukprot:GBG93290.1 hypothetical protein CBR_g63156 [Chara braunii]
MHSPVGQLQMQVTPMGFTNAVAETQRRMLTVAEEMFPEKCKPYIDDNPIKGARYKDETEGSKCFNCGGEGHFARECPSNQSTVAPRGGNGVSNATTPARYWTPWRNYNEDAEEKEFLRQLIQEKRKEQAKKREFEEKRKMDEMIRLEIERNSEAVETRVLSKIGRQFLEAREEVRRDEVRVTRTPVPVYRHTGFKEYADKGLEEIEDEMQNCRLSIFGNVLLGGVSFGEVPMAAQGSKCFNCGGEGHFARECPSNRSTAAHGDGNDVSNATTPARYWTPRRNYNEDAEEKELLRQLIQEKREEQAKKREFEEKRKMDEMIRLEIERNSEAVEARVMFKIGGEELGSPRGHSHEEAQPVVRLTEYRRVGCGYVLPWQRDEGMLDCQAGLEAEPVRTGMRRGMTEEEIARQVALITRDPIGASAPPSADAVFGKRACIFRSYPREDDSDEEPVPEAPDDPALRIPREINETHDDPDSEETRADTARRAADRADREMLGERSFGAHSGRSLPRAAHRRGGGTVGSSSGGWDATIATVVDKIASAAAAAVLEELAVSMLEEEAPAARGAATVDGQVAAAGGEAGGAAAVEVEEAVAVEEEEAPSAAVMEGGVAGLVEEEIAAQAKVQRGGDDERLMQQFLTEELDPVIAGFERQRGYCVQGGVMAREDVAEGVAAEAVDEALPGGAEAADVAVEGRPQAVDEAVQAGQRRDEGL